MAIKPLPKSIKKKLTPAENTKLERLAELSKRLGEKMLVVQLDYSKAARANLADNKLRRLADKGFKAEYDAFKASDAVHRYNLQLRAKYE